jgi:hypothetical protein
MGMGVVKNNVSKNDRIVKDIKDQIKTTGHQLKQKMKLIREDLLKELGEDTCEGKDCNT